MQWIRGNNLKELNHTLCFHKATGTVKRRKFRAGRKDCTGSPPSNRPLPHGSITNPVEFLQRQFKVNTKQAVALLGK